VALGLPYPARCSTLTQAPIASGLGRAPATTLFEVAPFVPPSLRALLLRDDKLATAVAALPKPDAAARVVALPVRDYVPEEDVWCCAICDDASAWPENALLQCANPACAVVVHQRCYGSCGRLSQRSARWCAGGGRSRGCAAHCAPACPPAFLPPSQASSASPTGIGTASRATSACTRPLSPACCAR